MYNIILADCDSQEIEEFKKGLEDITQDEFIIKSRVSNWSRASIWKKIKRYIIYFIFPLKIFFNRKKYHTIIGWQQFYTLIFCFYCRLFRVKKTFNVHVVNYTYKSKKGIVGKIYYKFFKYILESKYIDYLYVPSSEYIKQCTSDFNIKKELFVVLPFGVLDRYETYINSKIDDEYFLAIGRSNRDYDWLIDEWKNIKYNLYIISDEFKPNYKVPKNIKIIGDVSGNEQYPYIMNCKALIIPILKENICSGDTVLLTAFSFKKNVIVTKNSTLAEMYISDRKDGFVVDKTKKELKEIINLIANKKIDLGKNARNKYLNNFSRYSMGCNVGKIVKEN